MNKGTNCVTSYLTDCETQLSQAPRQGLLYGIPVSLKECFSYKVRPPWCQPSVLPLLCVQLWGLQRPRRLGLASVLLVGVSLSC